MADKAGEVSGVAMKAIISIDDTDNLCSPGSGQLAEELARELIQRGLAADVSTISDEKIKTVLHDHYPVVPVTRIGGGGIDWATLSPAESKRY
jgi:hypothetical protein